MKTTVRNFTPNLTGKVQFATSRGEFFHQRNGYGYRIKNNKMMGASIKLTPAVLGKLDDEVSIICEKF